MLMFQAHQIHPVQIFKAQHLLLNSLSSFIKEYLFRGNDKKT